MGEDEYDEYDGPVMCEPTPLPFFERYVVREWLRRLSLVGAVVFVEWTARLIWHG